jgi:hypothetical protein
MEGGEGSEESFGNDVSISYLDDFAKYIQFSKLSALCILNILNGCGLSVHKLFSNEVEKNRQYIRMV